MTQAYASLPPPTDANGALPPPYWKVLGISEKATLATAKAAYLALVKQAHPDHGGDAAKFNQIVEAWKQAQEAA